MDGDISGVKKSAASMDFYSHSSDSSASLALVTGCAFIASCYEIWPEHWQAIMIIEICVVSKGNVVADVIDIATMRMMTELTMRLE